MPLIRLALLPRFIVYTASIVLTLLLAVLMRVYPGHTDVLFLLLVISGGLAVLGTYDLVQTKHSVLRNTQSRRICAFYWRKCARNCVIFL